MNWRLFEFFSYKVWLIKELEEIEEKWKQETLKLIGMVNKLKDENKRLNESLNQNNLNSVQNDQLSNLKFFFFFEKNLKIKKKFFKKESNYILTH